MAFDGEDDFINDLKNGPDATADQTPVMDELFKDPDLQKLWDYLKKCKETIKLKVGRVIIRGQERYGGYSPGPPHELTINPHKQEHQDNPQEEAETILHELIHAVLDLRDKCGDDNYPLPADVTDLYHDAKEQNKDPAKSAHKDADKKYMDDNYGDSDSAPDSEYADENIESRRFIAKIIKRLIDKTKKGKPTKSVQIVDKLDKK